MILLSLKDNTIQWLSAIVLFKNLPVRHGRHPLVVEFEPPCIPIWFDEREVPPTVEVTGVYKYAVKLVLPGFGPVSRPVEEFVKVYFGGEFDVFTIDLRDRVRIKPITLRGCN